ncbi:MAG: hypothetical protein ABSE19_08210 [Candidatus Acidiferrum sp.]
MPCSGDRAAIESQEQLERLNRASDFFGDPIKRWSDWFAFVRSSKSKAYASGRAALISQYGTPSVGISKPDAARLFGKNDRMCDDFMFVVFNADIHKSHHLKSWNQELMLVSDIHLVNGPDGEIPSLVGFYRVSNKVMDRAGNLPAFERSLQGSYQFLPCIANWEPCPFRRSTPAEQNNFVVEQIQSAPKVMHSISNNKSSVGQESGFRRMDIDNEVIYFVPRIDLVDGDRVGVSGAEIIQKSAQIVDMFFGSFNLQVCASERRRHNIDQIYWRVGHRIIPILNS